MGDGHGQRQHSFVVDLDTCSSCHSEEMHTRPPAMGTPGEEITQNDQEPVLVMAGMPAVQSEPDPVGPMGFAILASLVGMGFGIVAAPWLTKWNKRADKGHDDEQ